LIIATKFLQSLYQLTIFKLNFIKFKPANYNKFQLKVIRSKLLNLHLRVADNVANMIIDMAITGIPYVLNDDVSTA
jgi:hypothetical protein